MAKKIKKKTAKKAVKKTIKKAAKKVAKKAVKKVVKKTAKKAVKKKSAAPAPRIIPSVSINPYVNFPGNCEEAFNFYRSAFGGNFTMVSRFKEMPPMEGQPPLPAELGEKLMHISLPIGKNSLLMGSDSSAELGHATTVGDNFSISINATSKSEADRLFNGLSAGGKVTMPIGDTFWGSYFGMFTDKFGINWMISFG